MLRNSDVKGNGRNEDDGKMLLLRLLWRRAFQYNQIEPLQLKYSVHLFYRGFIELKVLQKLL